MIEAFVYISSGNSPMDHGLRDELALAWLLGTIWLWCGVHGMIHCPSNPPRHCASNRVGKHRDNRGNNMLLFGKDMFLFANDMFLFGKDMFLF